MLGESVEFHVGPDAPIYDHADPSTSNPSYVSLFTPTHIAASCLHFRSLSTLCTSSINPYDLPGHLVFDKYDTHLNRWETYPYLKARGPPGLMRTVMEEIERIRRTRASDSNMTRQGQESGDERKERGQEMGDHKEPDSEPDLSWIRGKTVVLYGDSVLRYNMDHFCKASPFPQTRRRPSSPRRRLIGPLLPVSDRHAVRRIRDQTHHLELETRRSLAT